MSSNLTSSANLGGSVDRPSNVGLEQIYYIRHGETEWSKSGRHTGSTDIPLTDNGESEARALARWVSSVGFDRVLTSPRQRASRTAELAGLSTNVMIDAELAEWDYGDYEGRRTVDIRAERPDWQLWDDGCPRGESPDDITLRVDRLLDRLAAAEGNIALVAHGHIGAAIGARWCGLPIRYGRAFGLRSGSLSILGYDSHAPRSEIVALWNATPRQLSSNKNA